VGKHGRGKERERVSPMRISRDGREETRLTDTQKSRILELAQVVPRDQLLLGLQLEGDGASGAWWVVITK